MALIVSLLSHRLADYHRYIAEISAGETHERNSNNALEAYKIATHASAGLLPTHPIRLGLALNFSVFYHEILGNPKLACELAQEAFYNTLHHLDTVSEFEGSLLIMHLLRNNLAIWTLNLPGQLYVRSHTSLTDRLYSS